MTPAFIPSPSQSGFHLGPLDVHVYGLMYVLAVLSIIPILGALFNGKGIGWLDLVGYGFVTVCTGGLGTWSAIWWENSIRSTWR